MSWEGGHKDSFTGTGSQLVPAATNHNTEMICYNYADRTGYSNFWSLGQKYSSTPPACISFWGTHFLLKSLLKKIIKLISA